MIRNNEVEVLKRYLVKNRFMFDVCALDQGGFNVLQLAAFKG